MEGSPIYWIVIYRFETVCSMWCWVFWLFGRSPSYKLDALRRQKAIAPFCYHWHVIFYFSDWDDDVLPVFGLTTIRRLPLRLLLVRWSPTDEFAVWVFERWTDAPKNWGQESVGESLFNDGVGCRSFLNCDFFQNCAARLGFIVLAMSRVLLFIEEVSEELSSA